MEYVKSSMNEEELLAIWINNTKKEKDEINTKAYTETYAIFCTNNDLTKITKSGIKAPWFQADAEDEHC